MKPNPIILMGVWNLVKYIQANKSDPSKIYQYYQSEEEGLSQLAPAIPALIDILLESENWHIICLASLLLGSICMKRGVNETTRQTAIQAIGLAYEPSNSIDGGTSAAAKLLASGMLGYEPAVHAIETNARKNGYVDVREFTSDLFYRVIMNVASSSDEGSGLD